MALNRIIIRSLLLLISFGLFFVRADSNPAFSANPGAPVQVIILCDVSTSVGLQKNYYTVNNQDRIQKMIDSCCIILRRYPPHSFIRFQLVSSNIREYPFLETTTEEILLKTARHQKEKLRMQDTLILNKIRLAAANPEHRTCILTSIESAFNKFKLTEQEKPGYYDHCELIILSDMIECCKESPAGDIRMSDANNKIVIRKEDKDKIACYSTTINFDAAKIAIKIKLITQGMLPQPAAQLQDIWRTIFLKYKYSGFNAGKELF